jgi:hypothetical protein
MLEHRRWCSWWWKVGVDLGACLKDRRCGESEGWWVVDGR